ncbi:cell wall-binding protein [Paenibacillus pini JCM 16418]|uniref:Cell wall-binding protein n=1 Tax=Paenibacillus pini JCM 16418 TaxID=1236976 RepID=W7YID0_9BACL|nr:cell wall-binding protein [Paenibacillus pini JCM 16418]
MGIFQPEESHVSQSSSMSYGMRWKHEYLRQISLAAISSIAITLMVLLLVDSQSRKQVHLIVDGQIKSVETHTSLIQEMLDEQAITLKAHDQISIPLTGTIQDGDKVIIDHASPIQLTVDGKTKQLYTTRETVRDVIHDLGISIKGTDKVQPALTASVADQMDIKIVRINTQSVDRKEKLPFRVIKTADPSLTAGTVRVAQQGKAGL